MAHLSIALVASLVLAGCSKSPASEAVRKAQEESRLGATSKWKMSSAPWAASTQLMRDRAYAFCMSRHPGSADCLNESDWSLLAAHFAEITFATQDFKAGQRASALADNPKLFENARARCFSIYDDAGRADVRMVGPCLTNAIGGDYFGTTLIP